MKHYVIYDEVTGDILRAGISSDSSFADKTKTGEKIKEVSKVEKGMDVTHKVDINDPSKKVKKK